jgi:hypothetical protein
MDTAQRLLGDPIRGRNGAEAHRTGRFHGGGARPAADDSEGPWKGSLAGLAGSVRSSGGGRYGGGGARRWSEAALNGEVASTDDEEGNW